MSNGQVPTQTLELEIPTYLPLVEAAQKYDLSEQVLTQLIQAGKIEAVRLPSGELLVSAENGQQKTKEDIGLYWVTALRVTRLNQAGGCRQSGTVSELTLGCEPERTPLLRLKQSTPPRP
jgi:hypothetical protein